MKRETEKTRPIGRFGCDYIYTSNQQFVRDILEQCGLPFQQCGFLLLREQENGGYWSEVWSSGPNAIPMIDCIMRRLL
jgi:hypothetical protein